MTTDQNGKAALLKVLAKKYIWWESAEESVKNEHRVMAQVMNVGDFDDASIALKTLGSKLFEDALAKAQPGWFSPKSWAYWHYRCGITPSDALPPAMPVREIPE